MKNQGFWACLFALGAGVLTGCTNGGAAGIEPTTVMVYDRFRACEAEQPGPAGLLSRSTLPARPGAISLDCFAFPGSTQNAYELALGNKLDRNRLAYVLISQADSICSIEKALMFERQAEVNGLLSVATTGLSVVSSIVTGVQASNILSGGAAFASGSRDHFNTHVYRNQIIQTVQTAIDNKRSQALAIIETNLKQETSEYPIDAAIREINAYHGYCSFSTGLQTVMEAVERQKAYEEAIKVQNIEAELIRLDRDLRSAGRATTEGQAISEQMGRLREERILSNTDIDVAPPGPEQTSGQVVDGATDEASEGATEGGAAEQPVEGGEPEEEAELPGEEDEAP